MEQKHLISRRLASRRRAERNQVTSIPSRQHMPKWASFHWPWKSRERPCCFRRQERSLIFSRKWRTTSPITKPDEQCARNEQDLREKACSIPRIKIFKA